MLEGSGDLVVERLRWAFSPGEVMALWPEQAPLLALVSADARATGWFGAAPGDPDARRSVFALAGRARETPEGAVAPIGVAQAGAVPTSIGYIRYETGYAHEPRVFAPARAGEGEARWFGVGAALVHDGLRGEWSLIGREEDAIDAMRPILREIERGAAPPGDAVGTFRAGALTSVTGRARFVADARRIIERIHAGDVYQVNLAHHLVAPCEGSARALFARLLESARPALGALLEDHAPGGERRSIVSISPELFLDADVSPAGERIVRTRPIKGTRAMGPGLDDRAERALHDSSKDAAELAMIVDLMRNDLGRVCAPGTVRVAAPRLLERHAGDTLAHAVAEVSGRLRDGVGLEALLRATFPPGSVTGAPKIAAMKMIRELEPAARGAYCGAIGWVGDGGRARLSVAIRTATIERGTMTFPVGAGIVAESEPEAEWDETLAKAEAFRRGLESPAPNDAARRVVVRRTTGAGGRR